MTSPVILIIEADFYKDIAQSLAQGATDYLDDKGYTYERISVPGALEIPAAIAIAQRTGKYAGYVALGCVIRGETTHYDYVCDVSASGLNDIAITQCAAIGNGILTVENRDQAWVRADVKQKNKGAMAADACVALLELKQQWDV